MPTAQIQPYDNTAAATISSVGSIVQTGLNSSQAFAQNAVSQATALLTNLSTAMNTIQLGSYAVTPPISAIGVSITPFGLPDAPVTPSDIAFTRPTAPAAFTGTTVSPLSIGAPPLFTAVAPIFTLPTAPAALTAVAPTAPVLPTVNLPDSPTLVLPDVPTLLSINVPVEPLLNLPAFSALAPTRPEAPTSVFGFSEVTYTSTLLTSVRALLQTWVDGASTGLDPAIEAAIWERGRQRETVLTNRKIGAATRTFARSGFTRPPGALSVEINTALQEQQSTLIALSREVMIKQADLEQSNRRFAVEQVWKVEEGLIQYQGLIAARALEAAKFVQQFVLDVFREMVARYGHEVEAFNAQVNAFKEALQAELSKLEIFKSQIEAQRLIGTINEQSVSIYRERVTAARAVIDLFTAEVAASNAQAMVNKTQIEAFAALVGGYEATVRAKATEFQGYATRMQGEQTKAEIYKTQADAYRGTVDGYKSGVEALVSAKTIELDISQKVPLDVFKTNAEVFRALSESEAARVNARNKTYEVQTNVYDARMRGEGTRMNAEVSQYKAAADVAIAQLNANVEVLKGNLQALTQRVTLLVESAKGSAQVGGQMVAAALAGFNFSAGMHAQGSASVGYSASNSTNLSATSTDTVINETITNFTP